MASKMEVDSPKEEAAASSTSATLKATLPTSMIAVHPLAIVHMTDQHTRVTCGGSRYDVNSPVVGLLLGRWPETPATTTIITPSTTPSTVVLDADDIPLDMSEATRMQVSLHQAVFPLHAVVGWYRVVSKDDDGDDDEDYQPTEEDVRLTRDLQQFFQQEINGTTNDFLFALLHIPGVESSSSSKPAAASQGKSEKAAAPPREEEPLPLNLFRLFQNTTLVGLDYNQDWKLETSEPERVAIERVIRDKPTGASSSSSRITKAAAIPEGGEATGIVGVDSGYVSQAHSLQHSLEAMQQRIRVIMEYLASISPSTTSTENPLPTPPHPALLRQIHSLQCQLRLLSAASLDDKDPSNLDASLLAQLSTIAKAICSIQSYTEKLQAIQEHRMSASGGGGGGGSGIGSAPGGSGREDRRRRH